MIPKDLGWSLLFYLPLAQLQKVPGMERSFLQAPCIPAHCESVVHRLTINFEDIDG